MLKRVALNYLPAGMVRAMRKVHYRRQVSHYDASLEPDLRGCRRLIREGATVIDVGANIGVYTRFCSEFAGPAGQVYSVEPVPETYSYLVSNVRALGLKNVKCLNYAASDHDSDTEAMTIPQNDMGGSNLYEAALSPSGEIPVRTARLDTLFPDARPDFVKCDVEGHEVACIRGALELIGRSRPNWLVEVSKPETFELFKSLGYGAFSWQDGEFAAYDSSKKSVNYFFLPQER